MENGIELEVVSVVVSAVMRVGRPVMIWVRMHCTAHTLNNFEKEREYHQIYTVFIPILRLQLLSVRFRGCPTTQRLGC